MPFPTLQPTSRAFTPGNYPIKTFTAQSGAEVRILYGNKRNGMTLDLSYENITDQQADDFVVHYDDMKGEYSTFSLPTELLAGWSGDTTAITATNIGVQWRYAETPSINNVQAGRSSVQIKLVGVL